MKHISTKILWSQHIDAYLAQGSKLNFKILRKLLYLEYISCHLALVHEFLPCSITYTQLYNTKEQVTVLQCTHHAPFGPSLHK
jgi:hypothetical protein